MNILRALTMPLPFCSLGASNTAKDERSLLIWYGNNSEVFLFWANSRAMNMYIFWDCSHFTLGTWSKLSYWVSFKTELGTQNHFKPRVGYICFGLQRQQHRLFRVHKLKCTKKSVTTQMLRTIAVCWTSEVWFIHECPSHARDCILYAVITRIIIRVNS